MALIFIRRALGLGRAHLALLWSSGQMRWFGFRLRRRTGLDIVGMLNRAEAASECARERALLIDPDDPAAARLAGHQAFRDSLHAERQKKNQ